MSDKRYYWLKLKRDFFKRHDIQIIESMPNGKDYILFYLKLLCESVDHEGNLRFSEQIPYNEEMLSVITHTNIDIVRSAIEIFSKLNMMEIMDDGTYYMSEVQKMIGSETYWAEAKRKQREELDNVQQMSLDGPMCPTKSKSKSIDIDKDIDTPSFQTPIEESFLVFWRVYPKKVGKQDALKSFKKIKPSKELLDKMVAVIEEAKNTEQWTKNNGQYIPNPATWLNQGRWEDDISTYTRRTSAEGRQIEEDRFSGVNF